MAVYIRHPWKVIKAVTGILRWVLVYATEETANVYGYFIMLDWPLLMFATNNCALDQKLTRINYMNTWYVNQTCKYWQV